MTLRKGQYLFNEISKRYGFKNKSCEHGMFPYYNLHELLFYMPDDDFNDIMKDLNKVIKTD